MNETSVKYVPSGGHSATIAGLIKVMVGLVLNIAGLTLDKTVEADIVTLITMLVGVGLSLWGASQSYTARQSRGDIDALGKRLAPVEVVVNPETPPHIRP